MKIAILKERREGETRVAGSPDSIKKLASLGIEIAVESGAGIAAGVTDDAFANAGATVAADAETTLAGADIVLKVQRPMLAKEGRDEVSLLPRGALLVGMLAPHDSRESLDAYVRQGVTACAMELVPRITRAQAMDVLSSQANLAGYKAVLDAAAVYGRALPMMMTAAGTIPPAKVFVMGVGVAGLQAVATAKRLGAVITATDVRPAVKEQVQSLGGKFIAVEDEEFRQAETAGGYAKEMSPDYQAKQATLIAEHIAGQDIVITTALIPGRPAPRLVTAEMARSMRPGSVIVDLAAERGGNCELTVPGEVVERDGVTIIGHRNVPARLPMDASQLYARNLLAFLQPLISGEPPALALDPEDEILAAVTLTRDGRIVHPQFAPASQDQTERPPESAAESATG